MKFIKVSFDWFTFTSSTKIIEDKKEFIDKDYGLDKQNIFIELEE